MYKRQATGPAAKALINLDARGADHFVPLGKLATHERIKRLRRAAGRFRAISFHARFYVGLLQRFDDFTVEQTDCRRGRAFGRDDAVLLHHFKTCRAGHA